MSGPGIELRLSGSVLVPLPLSDLASTFFFFYHFHGETWLFQNFYHLVLCAASLIWMSRTKAQLYQEESLWHLCSLSHTTDRLTSACSAPGELSVEFCTLLSQELWEIAVRYQWLSRVFCYSSKISTKISVNRKSETGWEDRIIACGDAIIYLVVEDGIPEKVTFEQRTRHKKCISLACPACLRKAMVWVFDEQRPDLPWHSQDRLLWSEMTHISTHPKWGIHDRPN